MKHSARISILIVAVWSGTLFCGCAAWKPMKGIPVCELSEEFRMPARSHKALIDPSLLRQTPPREHHVDAGDILGIYVEGVLGGRQEVPPVNFRQNFNSHSSLGYPIRVRADGTISLPLAKPIQVRGMTLAQTQETIRQVFTSGKKPLLKKGNDRILVTLQRPRHYRVVVIRQESGNPGDQPGRAGRILANPVNGTNNKFGTGRTVDLPAYENDVLHALTETGGFPGLDAENIIYVIRRRSQGPLNATPMLQPVRSRNFGNAETVIRAQSLAPPEQTAGTVPHFGHITPDETSTRTVTVGPDLFGHTTSQLQTKTNVPATKETAASVPAIRENHTEVQMVVPPAPGKPATPEFSPVSPKQPGPSPLESLPEFCADATIGNPSVIRIPLRLYPGQQPSFSESDIILEDGDVVVIESRQTDVFFTGGLLGGGRFRLPRDQDLDVLQAMSLVQAERVNALPTRSIGGISALNQDITASASDLIVIRQMPNGGQLPIRVNLYNALRDPRERILVKPGDHLVLQYTRSEAIVAFLERHILDGVVLGGSSGLFFGN